MSFIPDRSYAWNLLKEYNKSDQLIKHALAVEAVMVYFAKQYGEDETKWGIVGLLHDLDYEMYPTKHCEKSEEILKNLNFEESYIHAILSHGYGICSDIKPVHQMEKVLYATDELTGLITACALMRPSKSLMDLELKSVKKKFKQPSFAAGVNRDIILKGCEMLEINLDQLITETIMAMRGIADNLGLGGI